MLYRRPTGHPIGVLAAAIFITVILAGCITTSENPGLIFMGTWEVEIDSELGAIDQTWEVEEGLAGHIANVRDGSTLDMFHIVVRGKRVTFEVVYDIEGQSVPASFVGNITDDTILGAFATEFGDAQVRGIQR